MASAKKQIQQLARQFFQLSLVEGRLSTDRVAGVLEYIEKHRPANTLAVLKAYRRLATAEFARGQAVVEHAGRSRRSPSRTPRCSPVCAFASATTSTNPLSPASSPPWRPPSDPF